MKAVVLFIFSSLAISAFGKTGSYSGPAHPHFCERYASICNTTKAFVCAGNGVEVQFEFTTTAKNHRTSYIPFTLKAKITENGKISYVSQQRSTYFPKKYTRFMGGTYLSYDKSELVFDIRSGAHFHMRVNSWSGHYLNYYKSGYILQKLSCREI